MLTRTIQLALHLMPRRMDGKYKILKSLLSYIQTKCKLMLNLNRDVFKCIYES